MSGPTDVATTVRWSSRIASILVGAARGIAGLLWLREGLTKYRAGFGAADIRLVVDSAMGNSRAPEIFQVVAEHIPGAAPGLFGVVMPAVETAIGVLLILGIGSVTVAAVSIGLLMTYWSADQLIGQYPLMVLLAAVVLLWPRPAARLSVSNLRLVRSTIVRARGGPTVGRFGFPRYSRLPTRPSG